MYYSDKPIASKCDDQLGRNSFATLLARSLLNLNSQDTFTIGLFGKWGSGKTSLVNMMLSEIEEQQDEYPESEKLIVVHFEPWNFSCTDQLLSQFFIRLSNEFRSTDDKKLEKIGEALETYSDAFELFSAVPVAGGLISYLGKKGAVAVGSKLKKDSAEKDILKQKEAVTKLLKAQSRRILVVIDDIDRLSNEQIRQVFQLVTSVAQFPNTIYLLVFDKDIVVNALEKVQEGSGKDYLEKIIQMPIQIPDIKPAKLRQILLDRLYIILSKYEGTGFQEIHWQRLYEPCIATFVDSLRTVNRLCNAVQFKLSSISTEIDFADIVAISVLEIQHPEVYEWIKDQKSLLTGEIDLSAILGMANKTQKEWKDLYSGQIKGLLQNNSCLSVVDKQIEEIISFLSHLFPYFGQKIGEIYGGGDLNLLRRGNRIAHPEKFDRYFSLNLDEIIIKKSEILETAFESDCESLVKTLLKQEKNGIIDELLREINALSSDFSAVRAKTIVSALLKVLPHLNTRPQNNLYLPACILAEDMVIELLNKINPKERYHFISDIIANADIFVLQSLANIIKKLELAHGRLEANGEERSRKKVISLEELLEIESVFVKKIKCVLAEHSLFDFGKWRVVCDLMEYFAPDYMKTYLENEFKDDSNIVRYFANSVTIWTGSGIKYEVNDSYKKYLTEERVLQAIESLKHSGDLFIMNEDIQRKCCAFYIYSLGEETNYNGFISEITVNKLLFEWHNS